VSEPRLFCISTKDTCHCATEQGTRPPYFVRDDVCRDIAENGEPYNPYKPPESAPQAQQPQSADQQQAKAQEPQQSGPVGSVLQKTTRALGTFPNVPDYHSSTSVLPPTGRDM
jgi:hypothetical protein